MWETAKEKLLCMMVLDDDFAKRVEVNPGPAFWRAFIVQDRETGQVWAKYRFKYADGRRTWFTIRPKGNETVDVVLAQLRSNIEDAINRVFGVSGQVECFCPPDDEGNPVRTIIWLEQRDLIENQRVE